MEASEILRAIVAHCSDEKLVLWAAREMQRTSHVPVSLATKYRQAIETGSMPDDVAAEMQKVCYADSAREIMVRIRLSRREREKLDENAQEAGMTVSEYIRSRCL